jgi:RHS repeat-associated protein
VGERFPTQILYTGNAAAGLAPYNAVDFVYEARNDVFSGFISDVPVSRPNRLKQIRTRTGVAAADGSGGAVARQWNFAYVYSPYSNRSLLTSVTDCNGDGSQCLPPTNFAWNQRDASKNTSQASTSSLNGPGISLQNTSTVNSAQYTPQAQFGKRAVVGDFNGDGKQDLLTNAAGSSTWTLCTSLGTSFGCSSLGSMPATSSENFFVGDFDGDGRTDVLAWTGGANWSLCLSSGTGFSCSAVTGFPSGTNYFGTVYGPMVGDFTGDGRDDVLFKGMLCTSTGSGFTCGAYNTAFPGMFDTPSMTPDERTNPAAQKTGDFDGDGQIDILAYQTSSADMNCHTTPSNNCIYDSTEFWRYSFGPTGLVNTSGGNTRTGALFTGMVHDVNGDGVTDVMFEGRVVRHSATGDVLSQKYYINTCFSGNLCSSILNQPTDFSASLVSVGDYLQTGTAVGLYGASPSLYVVPFNANGSQGDPAASAAWTSAPICPAPGSMQLGMDLDGDGFTDTLCYTPASIPGNTGSWTIAMSGSGSFPDRLQSVTDGNGLTTRWTYVSGNDASVVTPGPLKGYPTKNVHVTAPVVSKMSVDADSSLTAGKTLDTTYTYSGMRMDARGRGSLGFETVTSTEVLTSSAVMNPTNVVTTTQYSQAFPTIARTLSVTKVGGGVTLQSAVSTWAALLTQGPPGLTALYPYVRTQVTTGQDLDGTWLPKTTMQVGTPGGTDGIDAYGNVTASTTTTAENNGAGDVYQVTHKCTDFDNRASTTQWVLGLCRASSQTVTPDNADAPNGRSVSSAFDASGALVSSTSMPGTSLALTVAYELDPKVGVPTRVTKTWTDPLDQAGRSPATSMTYDPTWRFPLTVTNALGQVETHDYDAATGVQTKLVDVDKLTTTWKVDAWGRKIEEDRADGTSTTSVHRKCVDACGGLATNVDVVQHWAPGAVQMLAPEETLYDSRGRKLLYRTWNDANAEADTTWSYGDTGDLYAQTLPRYTSGGASGVTTISAIDILHRAKQVDRTNASGNGVYTTRYTYSALTTTTTDANLHTRTELLNALGKVKKVTDHNAQAVSYAYDGFGDLLGTADPVGNVVTMHYDAMGHKTKLQDPDLGTWSYIVDAAGHTRRQTDAKNQVTTSTYDLLDRLTQRVEPDQEGDWVYDTAANGVGRLAEVYTLIAATGSKDYRKVYAYDSLGRPSSTTTTLDWDYTELNTYDGTGRLATVTHRRSAVGAANVASNPTGTGGGTRFVPISVDDDLTFVVPVKINVGTGQFGLPEIQYTLGYNVRGAVSSVMRGSTTLWTLNAQDAAGRTRLATFGSGLATFTHYNDYTALLDQIQAGLPNGSGGVTPNIQSDTYAYDPVGSLLTRTWLPATGAAAMSETFTYDALDRLKTSQVSGLDVKNFGYDALGNLTSKTNVGTYAYPAAASARPHLVSGITGTVAGLPNPTFTYDNNGNTVSGLNRLYAWSAANLPVSVDVLTNGTAASANLRHEFMYGPERDRTREIVRSMSGTTIGAVQRIIYSAESIEKEIDAVAGTTKIRTYLPLGLGFTEEVFTGTAIPPTSSGIPVERFFHKDNLGSLVIVTDATQAVLQRMAYDPWGRRRQSNGLEVNWQSLSAQSASNTLNHKGYTDQEQLDDLSLVHLNGRMYDPMTGRMTSPDPTIPDPFDLQSLNRASYVRNSPMDKVDPTGFGDEVTGSHIKPVDGGRTAGAGAAATHVTQYADHSGDEKKPNETRTTSTAVSTTTKATETTAATHPVDAQSAAADSNRAGLGRLSPEEQSQAFSQVDAMGNPQGTNPLAGSAVVMVGVGATVLTAGAGAEAGAAVLADVAEAERVADAIAKTQGQLGKMLNWASKDSQSLENVEKEAEQLSKITQRVVDAMRKNGMDREILERASNKFADSLGQGQKLVNKLLENRKAMIDKILDLWPKD